MVLNWLPWLLVPALMTAASPLSTPQNYLVLAGHQVWQAEDRGVPAAASVVDRLEKEGLVDIMGHADTSPTFRVFPESRESVTAALMQAGITYRILAHDLARHLAEEERVARRDVPDPSNVETCVEGACPKPFTNKYMKFEEMSLYLQEVAAKSPGVELKSIGKSVEGRDIWRIHIKSQGAERRGAVWLEAGIHAREWISPAVALHLINDMVSGNTSVTQDLDVYVVPMANPDGYEYTWTTDRLWRKNRRPSTQKADCPGVDLNRNWSLKYGVGASVNPCSYQYEGTHPFSEPETEALKDEMIRVSASGDLKLVLALHSYGQTLLYPWGWTSKAAPNTPEMIKAGRAFAQAAAEERNTEYSVKNSGEGMYYASGATDDWAKGVLRVPYAYTLELPDTGSNGFILPASYIKPTAQEVWQGLQKLLPIVH